MSMEYPTSKEETREVPQGTPQPTPTEQDRQEPQNPHQQIQDIAIEIGEDPARLSQRRDMGEVLERMKEGITVTLRISRPRFWSRLTLDDLGLTSGNTLATSADANKIINDYFQLGRRSLLPKEYQEKLAAAEANARFCLQRLSFKTHWGAFVSRRMYQTWKDANEGFEAEFWKVRDEILDNYDAITEEVMKDFRPLAEDAWRRLTLGTALLNQEEDALTHEVVAELVERLRAGEGKERFVENYLNCIQAAMPLKWEIKDAFAYEIERAVVPLPSLLARDMEHADRIYQDRALQDARTRAELEAIEARKRAELARLSEQQQKERLQQELERDRQYRQLRAERIRQEEQLAMERDVLGDARRQKERIVQEFYTGVVQQINELIFSTTDKVLTSLEKNGGTIRGPVSVQLSNLVKQLKEMNFVENEQIEDQLRRLSDILPDKDEKEQAKKGLAKINTTRIGQVVRAINQEAEHILVDLGTQPRTRTRREQPLGQPPINLDAARRKARAGTVLVQEGQAQETAAPESTTTKRRRQKRTL